MGDDEVGEGVRIRVLFSMKDQEPFRVVLVEPEIPPNTGNIARLCAATGTELHLIEPLGFELSNRTLKRAGMDYWQNCVWKKWSNLSELLSAYPQQKAYFFSTKGEQPFWEVPYLKGDFLVFGRETKGLPETLLKKYSETVVHIPMPGPQGRSLNLANAVSIGLYEALRQTR